MIDIPRRTGGMPRQWRTPAALVLRVRQLGAPAAALPPLLALVAMMAAVVCPAAATAGHAAAAPPPRRIESRHGGIFVDGRPFAMAGYYNSAHLNHTAHSTYDTEVTAGMNGIFTYRGLPGEGEGRWGNESWADTIAPQAKVE